jgi:hypothetical protein
MLLNTYSLDITDSDYQISQGHTFIGQTLCSTVRLAAL